MQLTINPHQEKTKAFLGEIPDGREGTIATLRLMRQLVKQGKVLPEVRSLALSLVQNLDQKDYAGELRAIHAYVRDQFRYVRDTTDVETVHTVPEILKAGQGDCDDKAVLLAALLESIGHPTAFVALGPNRERFVHVHVATRLGPGWVAAETTEPVEVGWKPDPKLLPEQLWIYN